MIPTHPSELPAEVREFYEQIWAKDNVVLATNEVPLAVYLAEHGLGIGGDLRPGKRFWPLRLHGSAPSVQGGNGWVNQLYAEVSFCKGTGCKCSGITWRHCGERLATFYGAVLRLDQDDRTRGTLTVHDDDKCSTASTMSGPAVGQILATNLAMEACGGLGTRVAGTLVEARWWSTADAVRAARPCADNECTQGPDRLHLRLPPKPPLRDELVAKAGTRVVFTMTSIGMVDRRGRRPIERGIDGTVPAGWIGPALD